MSTTRLLLTFVVLLSLCLVTATQAGELRIETDVYSGDAEASISHTVTLFDSGTIYDFVEGTQQVVVFRLPTSSHAGQFILLDLKAQRRTVVTTEKIAALMEKLSKWALEQDDSLLQFSAQPEFEETFEAGTGQLTLDSTQWNYTVATVPAEDDETLDQYRQFMDWYTRLNVMMYGSPPPGPRLALNAALGKHGVVPVEIRRTVDADSTTLRATHLFSWRLSREDRAQVEAVRKQLTSFEKVGNKDFLASRTGRNVVRGQSK